MPAILLEGGFLVAMSNAEKDCVVHEFASLYCLSNGATVVLVRDNGDLTIQTIRLSRIQGRELLDILRLIYEVQLSD